MGDAPDCHHLLEQTQLASAGDGFGAALHLEFVENIAIVPFDRTQGEEKPRADGFIRESLGNELEYFQLACAQGLNQGLAWWLVLELRRGNRVRISFAWPRRRRGFNCRKGNQ